ncbi:MAG TPA: carboxypeptidase-like regulatory domain-containing protein, partial [Vicinamibacterales bacterium]|nr:carboxypeptidase-like regulatory domain-containing protein [Vicinamibacterales bacterium]
MKQATRMTALAVVGSLGLLCALAAPAAGQTAAEARPVTHIASVAPGSIQGIVLDEHGRPVVGATISALGATSAFAFTDRSGRFDLRPLSPGPYIVRAHLTGFVASRGQVVDVRPSARASSAIALRHANAADGAMQYPLMMAGIGEAPEAPPAPDAAGSPSSATGAQGDDHGEVAWRLRHARRGVLKDATVPLDLFDDEPAETPSEGIFGRASETSTRLAADFLTTTPFSGQVNLLTSGTFDSPQQLFTGGNNSRSTTYLTLGAPVGEHADWTARAALTQGDLSSWMVAGEYTTRAPARHRYDIGLAYSTQRYE